VIGRVGKLHGEKDYWYATPGKGSPFVATNGVRAGFASRLQACIWLAGVHDGQQEWLRNAVADAELAISRAAFIAAANTAAAQTGGRVTNVRDGAWELVVRIAFTNGYEVTLRRPKDSQDPGRYMAGWDEAAIWSNGDVVGVEAVIGAGAGIVRFDGQQALVELLEKVAVLPTVVAGT
jgi:hypothetical protein